MHDLKSQPEKKSLSLIISYNISLMVLCACNEICPKIYNYIFKDINTHLLQDADSNERLSRVKVTIWALRSTTKIKIILNKKKKKQFSF